MGLKNRGETETETCGLSEALLFATMCIVGLPVDVHIRDGSVYSGTFHTASVDGQYGIVLKEARLTKKGKCATNVANGSVIRTLVILSGDLVQVVAKGVFGPADGESGRMVMDDVEASVDNFPLPGIFHNDLKDLDMSGADKRKINQNRGSTQKKIHANGFMVRKSEKDQDGIKVPPHHLGDEKRSEHLKEIRTIISENGQVSVAAANKRQICDIGPKGEYEQLEHMLNVRTEKRADEEQSSSSSDTCRTEEKSVVEEHLFKEQLPSGVSWKITPTEVMLDNQFSERSSSPSSPDAVSSIASSASNSVLNKFSESRHTSSSMSVDSASLQSIESHKNSKEFKLNPGAKVFFPSFANPLLAASPVMPSHANITYLPATSPILPIAAAQPNAGIGPFVPRTSIPAKVVPFNNLTAGMGSSNSQLSQPVTGNMASRMQPLRYGGHHAVQTAPAHAPPNSQAVMVGQLGQLVYMQPTHDLVQTTAAIPQVSARSLANLHHVHYPKHQGTATGQNMQAYMPSPSAGFGQQPFMMQSLNPVMQPPIPANRPIPIQGPNVAFGAKFT